MIGFRPHNAHALDVIDRIQAWTRARFDLANDAPIMVSEIACGVPGCPPIETVVVFWTAPTIRHTFKAFKPVHEVTEDDVPPRWMKDAIIQTADDLSCC